MGYNGLVCSSCGNESNHLVIREAGTGGGQSLVCPRCGRPMSG